MATTTSVPQFGLLSRLKVICHGLNIVGPFAASLMAEHGATVINLESTRAPDMSRLTDKGGYAWCQERRNELALALNLASPEGQEVYCRLVQWADIVIESQKGGTYGKWGLSDERLWQQNPRLVIVHASGFGQTGLPEFVTRPCFDGIGQAFGGTLFHNGLTPPGPPIVARYANDYAAATFAFGFALAGYVKAQQTGQGESIDIAQYEVGWKTQYSSPMLYFQTGELETRMGPEGGKYAGVGLYQCIDGEWIQITLGSAGIMQRALSFLGLADEPEFGTNPQVVFRGSPAGDRLQAALQSYCDSHTAEEVEQTFLQAELPCSRIYSAEMMKDHPHARARDLFVEWEDPRHGRVKGVGVLPKAMNNPGRIWRGAPLYGQDNDDLLREFGYSMEEIERLYENGIVRAEKGCH